MGRHVSAHRWGLKQCEHHQPTEIRSENDRDQQCPIPFDRERNHRNQFETSRYDCLVEVRSAEDGLPVTSQLIDPRSLSTNSGKRRERFLSFRFTVTQLLDACRECITRRVLFSVEK